MQLKILTFTMASFIGVPSCAQCWQLNSKRVSIRVPPPSVPLHIHSRKRLRSRSLQDTDFRVDSSRAAMSRLEAECSRGCNNCQLCGPRFLHSYSITFLKHTIRLAINWPSKVSSDRTAPTWLATQRRNRFQADDLLAVPWLGTAFGCGLWISTGAPYTSRGCGELGFRIWELRPGTLVEGPRSLRLGGIRIWIAEFLGAPTHGGAAVCFRPCKDMVAQCIIDFRRSTPVCSAHASAA